MCACRVVRARCVRFSHVRVGSVRVWRACDSQVVVLREAGRVTSGDQDPAPREGVLREVLSRNFFSSRLVPRRENLGELTGEEPHSRSSSSSMTRLTNGCMAASSSGP